MQCGIACLSMVCRHYGKRYSVDALSRICFATTEGVSMLAITQAAEKLGFETKSGRISTEQLGGAPLPCILHWNQNHFVVLYKVSRGGQKFHVADPGKGKICYSREEFERHWVSTQSGGEGKGIAMFLEPTQDFYDKQDVQAGERRSFRFLWGYMMEYRQYFLQIFLGLLLGCVLQLIMPFLTQGIVDLGIRHKDVGLIWMILFGELMIVVGRTATDFIRRRLLLHISMRINISLVSDFFIKLLKLPMSFFDTKLMGDLLQRMGDHSRVQSFLTNQVLSVMFAMLGFVAFGVVLFIYNRLIFAVFLLGSLLYGLWIAHFLGRRKVLDYELFEQQAINQNKTYQFITSMQEIKLQDCERRRRWEWEDTQADLFDVQMKSLKLQQTQQAARIACIHDYVMSLPLKYNTKIGRDGVGLSQGQKQRILIARAVYKNPDFIFLDEATNSLDAKNERGIVQNLDKFYEGRTVVVVAHRLSTVRNADQIVVIDNGRIAERGDHASLIAKKGAYYDLVKNQLELGN